MGVGSMAEYWAQLERERGLPSGYLGRTRQIESSGNPMAVSPTGPVGPFQFTKATAKQYGLPLDQRTDEYASARAAADYAKDNMSFLSQRLGRPVGGADLYMAHQQGAGGALGLLKNVNAPAGNAAGSAYNIAVNSGDPNAPAGSFVNKFAERYHNAVPAGGNTGQGPTVANAAALPVPAPAATPAAPVPNNGMPPPVIGEGKGLIGMATGEGGITGDKMKTFLGGGEVGAAVKGLGMMAQGLAGSSTPAPQIQAAPIEDNRPDMSLLAMMDPKRKRQKMGMM